MRHLAGWLLGIALLAQSAALPVHAGEVPASLRLAYDGTIHQYTSRLVDINIDGETVETGDMPAVIMEGRTLVPAREVFESDAFGATVDWDDEDKKVRISFDDQLIELAIDSRIAYVNGQPLELDVPAKLIQDTSKTFAKTMIPLRFVSEQLGIFDVDWDSTSYTALLTSRPSTAPELPVDKTETPAESDGEKLDSLVAEKAARPLPTALEADPVLWKASRDDVEALNAYAALLQASQEEAGAAEADDNHAGSLAYTETELYRAFVIKASAPLAGYKESNWNDKLIIDLQDTLSSLDSSYSFSGNPVAETVRTSQFEQMAYDGRDTARIVFDLKDTSYKHVVSLSDDGKTMTIAFAKDARNLEDILDNVSYNIVSEVNLKQNDEGDYIEAVGFTAPDVRAFRLTNPNRIVFDLLNTKSALYTRQALEVDGQYAKTFRTGQFDETTTRIVVETDGQADFDITQSGGRTLIQLKEPSYSNIVYENLERPTFTLAKDSGDTGIDLEGITYINDYLNRTYRIILPRNYEDRFGSGEIKVNDGLIDSVAISTNKEGRTELTIRSSTLHEYRIEERSGNIDIVAYKPSELYSKVIVVDPGHGGRDPGAGSADPAKGTFGLVEKELNLDITLLLKALLDREPSIKVYYTRLDDSYPTLQERCDLANEAGADFFLSIHHNAYLSSYRGTDVLHYSNTRVPGLDNYELADIFLNEITTTTGMPERRLVTRPDLYVLRMTDMPAALVEMGFITNAEDAAILGDPEFQQAAAQALYQGILRTFNEYPTGR